MNTQVILSNSLIYASPLRDGDFDLLYEAASDPLIWQQHPNPDRYQQEVFQNFFHHALLSNGAYLVRDKQTGQVIGSSRYYNFNPVNNTILIGYTFFRRSHWGGFYNYSLKYLMLNHAFQSVVEVYFHIGSQNFRSQKSIERLGASKTKEIIIAYEGEPERLNIEYVITKDRWPQISAYLLSCIDKKE